MSRPLGTGPVAGGVVLVSLLVILAATLTIVASILLGIGGDDDCAPAGQQPADMPHVVVTPSPYGWPGPTGGPR